MPGSPVMPPMPPVMPRAAAMRSFMPIPLICWVIFCTESNCLTRRFTSLGWVPLPEQLQMLNVLANPWVLGIAAIGAVMEFLADKVLWLDSVWDTLNSLIRPVGGALRPLPRWQRLLRLHAHAFELRP